jgi:hypothetical protein
MRSEAFTMSCCGTFPGVCNARSLDGLFRERGFNDTYLLFDASDIRVVGYVHSR